MTGLDVPQPGGVNPAVKDRFQRMLKARADALQKPVLDDQGTVLVPAQKPVDSIRTAIRSFSGFIAGNPDQHGALRDYLDGKTDALPQGWIPDNAVKPSMSTLHGQSMLRAAEEGRKESPYLSAAADAASVVGGYAGAFAQGVTDLGVGVANRLGGNIAPVNVKAKLRAFAQSVVPWGEPMTEQQAADEIAAMEGTQNGVVDVLRRSTEVVGNVHQMMGGGALGLVGKAGKTAKAAQAAQNVGVVGKTVNAITNVTGAPFRAAAQLGQGFGKLSPMASAAAGFAAHSALTAAPGQAVEAAKEGAVSGAIMGVMGEMGRGLYRYILKQPAAKMGIDGKNASETLKKWAADNGVFRAEVETAENYSKRLLNSWIDGGMQGAQRISMDKVRAIAAQGAFEGVGFSALDVKFREQIMAGIAGHDVNWGEVAKIYSANFLGTVGMHVPLRDIPGFQRRDWVAKTGTASKQQPAPVAQEPAKPKPSAPPRGGGMEAGTTIMEGEAGPKGVDPGTLAAEPAPSIDKATGTILGRQPTLTKFGWKEVGGEPSANPVTGFDPSVTEAQKSTMDRESQRLELPGTDMGIEVVGDSVRPTVKLREALRLPEEMPMDSFLETLERNSLMSSLAAKENLPGVEISSDQGVYATEDGVMRKIVPGGDVVESPLQPNPKWVPSKGIPARGKDPIPAEQQQIADAFVEVVNGREDLLEADRHMLSQLAETMNTVSAQNDRSVAETVAMAGPFLEQIINGDPVQAGKAIKGLAEMMTIKAPEVVMREMQQDAVEQESQQAQPVRATPMKRSGTEAKPWSDESGNTRNDYQESGIDPNDPPPGIEMNAADFVSQGGGRWMWRSMGADEFSKLVSGEKTYGGKAGRGNYLAQYPEKAARINEDGKVLVEFGGARPKGETSATILGNSNVTSVWRREGGQWVKVDNWRDTPPSAQMNSGIPVPPEVVAGLKTTGRGAKGIVEKGWNYFQQSLMKRAEAAGLGGKLGGIIRKAVTNTRKYISGHSDAGLFDLKRTDRKAQRALGEEILSDKFGGHTTLYYAKTDKDAAGYFGEGRNLTPEEQKVIDTARGTISHGARIAEEQGVKFRNLDGGEERGITYDPNRKIGPRVPTSVMTDATMNRRGPVWDALVKWFGDARGKTVEEVTQEYVNRSSAVSFDPTEHVRFERVIPTRLTVEGKIVKLFEDTPVEHAEKLAWRNAHIMGAISAIPRDAAKKPGDGASEYRSEVNEALPENAQQLLNDIQTEFGKDAAREAEGIIRSLHGMSIRNDPSWAGTPGTDTHTAIKVIGDAFGVMKALALSASSVVNIPEPIANAPLLTLKAITNGYGTILRAFKDKSLGTLHRDLVSEGFLVDSKENIPHGSDGLMERWDENLQKSKELLMTPMRLLQDANELILASAAKERLGAMQRGEGVDNDLAALKLLGFQANEAMAMIQGKGSPEMYAEYKNRIVSNLTGGKGLHGVEKSMAAHSRGFNAIVWFSNFFQARSRAATAVYERFREAPDFATKKDAAMQLASFAGFTALSGLLGNVIKKWVLGDDAGDYLHEMAAGATTGEQITNGISSFAQLALSGLLGGAGQLISDPLFGPAKEGQSSMRVWAERLGGLIAPLGTVAKGADFLGALRGQDVPGYEGKTGWQALAKYITNVAPLARGLDKGLFGLGVLAITEKDKDLDDAQDSYYRWLFKNAPPDGGDRSELGKEWRDSMRKVVDQVQDGKSYGDEDLMDALVEAQMAHVDKSVEAAERSMELGEKPKPVSVRDAKTAMAASLRARQFFSAQKMSKLTADQVKSLQAHLGEENVARLKDYDTILDALAKRVSPTRRF